jgi:acetoin utilization deacetylase AcuC-like enzyme
MLKKETLKQAIDAIAARDPEIGYSLLELFCAGHIDVEDGGGPDGGGLAYYTFNRQRVPVRNMDLFLEGPALLEQSLLIRYGEMFRKQALSSSGRSDAFAVAGESIRSAGLARLVEYEVRRAADRLGKEPEPPGNEAGLRIVSKPVLTRLLEGMDKGGPKENFPARADDPGVLFTGAVDADTPAYFTHFPYTRTALIQVADLGLSFFSVRFVVGRLMDGTARNLFACIVDGALAGLVYLKITRRLMHEGIEIKYIASARDARADRIPGRPPHRGVGTFMVAGVWLLWKNRMPSVREIRLDAEIKALGFYEEIGFEKRRPYVYALKRPDGYLLNALAVMVDRSRNIQPRVVEEIQGWIRANVRRLRHRSAGDPDRDRALAFIKLCLLSRSRPRLARTAARHLLRRRSGIPEAEGLLQWASRHGRIQLAAADDFEAAPLLVFRSVALQQHLQGIFHLDSPGRLQAIDEVLGDTSLAGKWTEVKGRTAMPEELAWIHTARHIRDVAATAGNSLHGFDLDTQATGASYASACRAVGGVFSLLDEILSTSSRRGFAAVRPPGHHAEPDRAMGFCLFNNTALGACYLKHVWGLRRVMIVDIDAHHGNGTQAAFYNADDVLFISMHQFPCYPGTGGSGETGQGPGEGFNVNVPLDKGMGDREFLQVVDRLVEPLACAFLPEMILVSCGFDLYSRDRLAQLGGTPDGYAMITCLLSRIADMVCGGRIAFIMEGGYSIQGIRRCSLRIFQEMCGMPSFDPDRLEKYLSCKQPSFSTLRKTIEVHKRHWSILNR